VKIESQYPISGIKIYNTYGMLIKETSIEKLNNTTIDVSNLVPGIYWISIKHANGILVSTKLLVESH
jgi:hypothetical protein